MKRVPECLVPLSPRSDLAIRIFRTPTNLDEARHHLVASMRSRSPACTECGSRADVLRLRFLHDSGGQADVCRSCVESAAEKAASIRDTEAKISAVRTALDKGMMAWYTADVIYVVPPRKAERWRLR